MRPMYDATVTKEDGTPLRKYEVADVTSSRAGVRFALTLILGNMFLLLKNVFFPDNAQKFGAAPLDRGGRDAHGGEVKADRMPPSDEEAPQDAAKAPDVEELEELPTFRFHSRGSSTSLELIEEERTHSRIPGFTYSSGTLLIASNDNPIIFTVKSEASLSDLIGKSGTGGGGSGSDADERDTDDDRDDEDPRTPPRVNRLPVVAAPIAFDFILASQSVVFALSDLLRNAHDPDGDTLKITSFTSSKGQTAEIKPGLFVFTPDPDSLGPVTFSYLVSDGTSAVSQTATVTVITPEGRAIAGSSLADVLIGTDRDDIIEGFDGDDTILALADHDVVYGGDGHDRIFGGDGDDVIYGGPGDDVIFAGKGRDVVSGGAGDDVILGEEGEDTLFGDAGDDTVSGGDGQDFVDGGDGDDDVQGDEGDDVLLGAKGDDKVLGGEGDDRASGGEGDDDVRGEEGDDTLFGDAGDDTVSGGDGQDFVDGGDGDDDVQGGEGDDVLLGAKGDDKVLGGEGDDRASGGEGDDHVRGEEGDDILFGDAGCDTVSGGDGHDLVDGGEGDDALYGDAGDDVLLGGAGADHIEAGAGQDEIDAGADDDVVDAGIDDDVIYAAIDDGGDDYDGGEGSDTYDISATYADATIDLFAGLAESEQINVDSLRSIENVVGGGGNDIIVADTNTNQLMGGAGDDIFVFRTTASAGSGSGSRDRILDFEVGDKIDLDDISREFRGLADALEDDGIKKFVLIKDTDIFKRPGELRFKYDDNDDSSLVILEGNIDTDADTDFEIEVFMSGNRSLQDHDFTWNT